MLVTALPAALLPAAAEVSDLAVGSADEVAAWLGPVVVASMVCPLRPSLCQCALKLQWHQICSVMAHVAEGGVEMPLEPMITELTLAALASAARAPVEAWMSAQ